MKLLVLCGSFEPTGGTQVYVRNAIDALAERGHEVLAVSADRDAPAGLHPRSRFLSLPPLFDAALRPGALRRCRRAALALRERWRAERIDAALLNLEAPLAVHALERDLPTIRFVHTPGTYCPAGTRWLPRSERVCEVRPGLRCFAVDRREGCLVSLGGEPLSRKASLRRILDMPLQGLFLRGATLVAVPSEHAAAQVRATFGERMRVAILAPPVRLYGAPARAPIPGRLFAAARLVRMKGIADTLEVVARLPAAHLVVAGDGPERPALEASSRRLGIAERVQFRGWLPAARLEEEMSAAAVVLFPSYVPETFGMVGAEAAMLGRPVVAYRRGGVEAWLSADTGALVAAGDIAGMTREAGALLADPRRAAALGENARRAAESFSPARFAERLEGLLAEVVARFAGSSA